MLFKKNKPIATADPTPVKSQDPTLAASENVTVSDLGHEQEKEVGSSGTDSRSLSSDDSRHKAETTGLGEAAEVDNLEDEVVYPSGAKLAFITFALSLSVFCVALVCDSGVSTSGDIALTLKPGQHNPGYCHTQDNRCLCSPR